MKKMTYKELAELFRKHEESNPRTHLTGAIVFSADSWKDEYSEESRTYIVSSDNKAYRPGMGGYSIFGTSKDLTDCGVRLDRYMREEKGGKDGWKVDYCYLLEGRQS